MNYEEYIKEHFQYDNQTGLLSRNDRKGGLGSVDKDGYLIIKVKGKQFKYHRVVWLLCYGQFPKKELDHIDRNKLNNRIENLEKLIGNYKLKTKNQLSIKIPKNNIYI